MDDDGKVARINKRSKAFRRRVRRFAMSYGFGREFGGSCFAAEDLYYAAVATLVDDGVVAKWVRRRDIRGGTRAQAAEWGFARSASADLTWDSAGRRRRTHGGRGRRRSDIGRGRIRARCGIWSARSSVSTWCVIFFLINLEHTYPMQHAARASTVRSHEKADQGSSASEKQSGPSARPLQYQQPTSKPVQTGHFH